MEQETMQEVVEQENVGFFDDIDDPIDEKHLYGDEEEPGVAEEAIAEEPVKAEEEPKKTRDDVIPRGRFDELHAKYKAEEEARINLEERLRAVESEKVATQKERPGDISDLEKQYMEAVLDADDVKAVEIRGKINDIILTQAEERAEKRISARETQRQESENLSLFNQTVHGIIEKYPLLDSNSTAADKAAIDEVVELRDFYIFKGEKPHTALARAAEKVMKQYATPDKQETQEPRVDLRKSGAIARNIEDAKRQPPVVSGVGERMAPPVIPSTQDGWEKLSDKEREKLLK